MDNSAAMDPDVVELIEFEIKYSMYYIEYPEHVPVGIWKDGAGKFHYMCDMGLDHLKAAAHMVDRDIKRLERSDRSAAVMDALIPKAKTTLAQLRAEFARKARL